MDELSDPRLPNRPILGLFPDARKQTLKVLLPLQVNQAVTSLAFTSSLR